MPTLNNTGNQRPWLTKSKPFDKAIKLNDTVKIDTGFYNTQSWRRLSKKQRFDYPLCCVCERKGYVVAGTVADHIKPSRLYEELREQQSNLQTLCSSHHNRKSGVERHMKQRKDYYRYSGGKVAYLFRGHDTNED